MSTTAQLSSAVQPKAPVAIGRRGIELTSLDELYRFSQYISKSGFAPKGMEAPESIVVAIEMGLELGLTPMQSIQNIAVINGRPSVWGDVPLALARASGVMEIFEEYYEQDGKRLDRAPVALSDGTAAVCRLKRVNQAPHSQSFSVADAKRAGLWGKPGPWTQYPLRMLQMRARGFALRDQLGDFLKGLITREEAQDLPEDPVRRARNVTPQPVPPIAELQTSTQPEAASADDIPMDFKSPAAAQAAPAATANTQGSSAAATRPSPQGELYEVVKAAGGVTWDGFREWLLATQQLDESVVCDGFEMLPSQLCESLLAKPKILNPALKMIRAKEGAR